MQSKNENQPHRLALRRKAWLKPGPQVGILPIAELRRLVAEMID